MTKLQKEFKDKYLRVTMPDGSTWDIPILIIAENRAKYYAENDEDFLGDVEKALEEDTLPLFASDEYEIMEWASNNMDWDDVSDFATMVEFSDCDYQEGWINGDKEIVEVKDRL